MSSDCPGEQRDLLLSQLRAQQAGGYGAPSHIDGLWIYAIPLPSGSKEEHLAALAALERTGVIAGHSYIDASSACGNALAVVDAAAGSLQPALAA